jgi:hypothetical protein
VSPPEEERRETTPKSFIPSEFIEKWLMQCPDPDLMSDVIRELDNARPFLPGPASSTD